MQRVHALRQLVQAGFALGTAHQFARARHKQVNRRDRLAVVVLVHIERLDVLRPVIDEHRAMEVFLGQVLFMLLGGVFAILRLELEAILHLAQNRDGFLVGDTRCARHSEVIQLVQQSAAGELVEEFQLIRALLQHRLDKVLQEVLFNVHQLMDIAERDFRLDHPEFRRVGLGVAVFGAEGRAKGVHLGERHRKRLGFKLTRHGEGGGLAEEVVAAVLLLRRRQRRHGEGVARALSIVGGNQRRMHIEIAAVLEVGVNGHACDAADAENRLKQARTRAQIRDFAQVLHAVALRLKRVILRAVAFEVDGNRLHFGGRRIFVGRHNLARHGNRRADMQGLDGGVVLDGIIVDHLRILEASAIEKVDEAHVLLLAVIANPALQHHRLSLQFIQALFQFARRQYVHWFSFFLIPRCPYRSNFSLIISQTCFSCNRSKGHCPLTLSRD